mgnify:CR=1 FL=1
MFNRIYKVYIQAEAPYREHKENINLFFVKAANGAMVPLTSLGNASYTTGPGSIKRFNMFTAMTINGNPADGYSSGEAIKAIEEVAAETLPVGYGYEFSGMTREEQGSSSGTTAIIFMLCLVFVYLLLSAQYESYILPLSVILSIPFGLAGSFIFALMMGVENNICLLYTSPSPRD